MRPHRSGLLASCAVDGRRIGRVAVRPVVRRDDPLNQPELLSLDDPGGRAVAERVCALSRQIGSEPRMEGDELIVVA